MKTKVCSHCGRELPVESFSAAYKNICKECRNKMPRSSQNRNTGTTSQRRYEIAKEYFVRNAMESRNLEEAAEMAVKAADTLLAELQKQS